MIDKYLSGYYDKMWPEHKNVIRPWKGYMFFRYLFNVDGDRSW